jgi:signal transduction histidine kinase
MDQFRLSGMYGEIRIGNDGGILLARVSETGSLETVGRVPGGEWPRIARSDASRIFGMGPSLRGVSKSIWFPAEQQRVSVVVAGSTDLLEATLVSFRTFLAELALAGLIVAVVGGYWLAARTLGPIAALTEQVESMAARPPGGGPHRVDLVNEEDELGRLGGMFNVLLAKIDAAADHMRTFLADAAHEMKTPVAIVRTEAELSLVNGRSSDELRQALASIVGESERLSHLVRDLTLLAEGQALEHPVQRRLVDLNELVRDVVHSLRLPTAERGLKVSVEAAERAEYKGDERLLRQMLTNLLENAIKFSPAGSLIEIGVAEERGGYEIDVLDRAGTLAPEERMRVFDRFYRTPSARDAAATGSGLGLAIVQWAVRLHGGDVCVEPRTPTGNRFVVRLPRPTPPGERREATKTVEAAL